MSEMNKVNEASPAGETGDLERLVRHRKRRRYVAEMMQAIDMASTSYFLGGKSSKTDGLRVIRRFEKINGIAFDPKNSGHLSVVSGNGHNENFFRREKRVTT